MVSASSPGVGSLPSTAAVLAAGPSPLPPDGLHSFISAVVWHAPCRWASLGDRHPTLKLVSPEMANGLGELLACKGHAQEVRLGLMARLLNLGSVGRGASS